MPLVRPCRNRHCPEHAGPDGWCDAHRRAPFASSAPMPPGWPAIRAGQLAAFPFCHDCGAPATEVHHIRRRADGGGDEPGNLRSLCGPCHRRTTGATSGIW